MKRHHKISKTTADKNFGTFGPPSSPHIKNRNFLLKNKIKFEMKKITTKIVKTNPKFSKGRKNFSPFEFFTEAPTKKENPRPKNEFATKFEGKNPIAESAKIS